MGHARWLTHNWNPYWNTSIFGAWATVRYGNEGKALICGVNNSRFTPLVVGGIGTCNPDFSLAVIGTKTAWTPVKNLTFSAEYAFAELDQNFSGLLNGAVAGGNSAIGKPSGAGVNYVFKNENTQTFLLRAQRNW